MKVQSLLHRSLQNYEYFLEGRLQVRISHRIGSNAPYVTCIYAQEMYWRPITGSLFREGGIKDNKFYEEVLIKILELGFTN